MTTTTVKTIGAGGDYTTLQSWEDAAPANLVTADVVWQGQIISAATGFSGSATLLTMSGSTSDATRYKELTAAAGASFADNANIQTNALRYNTANGCYITASPSYGPVVSIGEAYARVNKVQIAATSDAHAISSSQATSRVDRCILEGVKSYVATGSGYFTNTLMAMRGSGQGRVLNMTAGGTYLYNCTLVSILGSANAITSNNYGVGTFQNCAFFGVTTAVKGSAGTATYTSCYTDVASPPTGCTQVAFDTSTGSGFENITSGTHDFRIKSTSALIGVGTTDATYAATDIAGTARPSGTGYDVGAWEYVTAGGGSTGTAAITNAGDTSSASGTTTVTGTVATTNAGDTSAASGSPVVAGTAAIANAGDVASASGAVGNDAVGTGAVTNAGDAAAAVGTTTVVGTGTATNGSDTAIGAGTVTLLGQGAVTNGGDVAAGVGVAGVVTGTASIQVRDDRPAAYGVVGTPQAQQRGGWAPDMPRRKREKPDRIIDDVLAALEQQNLAPTQERKVKQAVHKIVRAAQPDTYAELTTALNVSEIEEKVVAVIRKAVTAAKVKKRRKDDEVIMLMM